MLYKSFIFYKYTDENLLLRGKATAVTKEISLISVKICESIEYFKNFLNMPLEGLLDALEDEDEDALEALWDDVELEMDAMSETEN